VLAKLLLGPRRVWRNGAGLWAACVLELQDGGLYIHVQRSLLITTAIAVSRILLQTLFFAGQLLRACQMAVMKISLKHTTTPAV
jgi:hypothetical protein